MANNRIYLICKNCGGCLYLGATMSNGYYYENFDNQTLQNKLNEFYYNHNWCLGKAHNDNLFGIKYEIEEEN